MVDLPVPPLGVGLTYWPGAATFIADHIDLLDVIEVSPETLWYPDGYGGYVCDTTELSRVVGIPLPKTAHGVGNPVGGAAGLDLKRLELFVQVSNALGATIVTEHLSFARVCGPQGSYFTGFMLPPCPTDEGVTAAASSARAMAAAVAKPFAIENGVSYLRPARCEIPDSELVASVADDADVGILLDLHNAYTNERNGRQTMAEFVDRLPLDRVVELHLAGGTSYGNYWVDAHAGAMPDAVFAFAAELAPDLPNLRVVNFELFPAYFSRFGPGPLARELEKCRHVWESRSFRPPAHQARARDFAAAPATAALYSQSAWEGTLGSMVLGGTVDEGPLSSLSADPGAEVWRALVGELRTSMVARALKLTTRLLLLHMGEQRVRDLCETFSRFRPPEFSAEEEAEAFGAWLAKSAVDVPHVPSVIAFELAVMHAYSRAQVTTIEFQGDPGAILGNVARRIAPPPPTAERLALVVGASTTAVTETAGGSAQNRSDARPE